MANTSPKFGGLVVASLAGVVGTKYLLGGALAAVEATSLSSVLVLDSIPATFAVGTILGLVTGALVSAFVLSRQMAIAVFLGVIALSVPALRAADPVILVESVGMALSILYLLVRSPVERIEQANVDESDSASRHGSTLR
ncbi:hypothetical protein EGH22_05480 [Halomicroarcula sp. F28]|uniref:hypothetical protein n=1 Tax=Haloarcula salinisoli TaxID=2487746 RepID=UPI001C7391FC|nr:hypothetical protein [Halomicroarcula salinisoli]MBX0285767.1 hypothetical protein [Halomicroarcula salinisoli]